MKRIIINPKFRERKQISRRAYIKEMIEREIENVEVFAGWTELCFKVYASDLDYINYLIKEFACKKSYLNFDIHKPHPIGSSGLQELKVIIS